jgi:hypothetical protein
MKKNDRLMGKLHIPHSPFGILPASCLLLFALLLASCAMHGIPPHLMNANAHPRFRPESYITAIGVSDQSLKMAQEFAREEVSNQVHSKIKAQFQSWEENIRRNDQIIDKEHLIHVVETRTSFAHGEMIRIDQAGSMKTKGLFRAFAYLSRADIYDVFKNEYETAAATFRRAAHNAGGHCEDLPSFTANLRQVQDSFADLQALSFKMHAIAGRWHEAFLRDQELFREVEKKRVDVLSNIKLVVELGRVRPAKAREVILMKLTGALTRLHIEATPSACGPQKYSLHVDPTIKCSSGYFGPECTLSMAALLSQCDTKNTVAEFSLNHDSFKGVDTHQDKKALEDLYNNISVDKLRPLLQTGLSSVFPVKRGK